MATERVLITLELEVDGDHISGSADDGGGELDSFLGWLGLIGVLDRLLERTGLRELSPAPKGREGAGLANPGGRVWGSPR